MRTKQPTIEDIYNFDAFINTPGVRQGLLERASDGDPELAVEQTDDGEGVYYTAPHGEQIPVGRPIQLAMGGGGGKGSNLTMTDAGMAMLDTGAGVVRGAVAQTLGLPGDIEMIGRGLRSVFNRPEDQSRIDAFLAGMKEKTALPTTDRVSEMLPPVVPPGAPDAKMRQHNAKIGQAFGEIAPLPGAIEAGVAGAKALAPTAAGMVVNSMDKLGTPIMLPAVPLENFSKVITSSAAKVDRGTVKLSDKVSKSVELQLDPKYRVKVVGAYKPEGKTQNITNAVNPGNYEDVSIRLDDIAQAFPDPLESPEKFSTMLTTVYNSTEVPMPPKWMIENVNDMGKWTNWFGSMTQNQIDEASRGFAVVDKFKQIYTDGTAGVDTTGRLMMWAMLSRRASAYPHESGFLDLADKMTPLIQKAARGEFTDADIQAGLQLIKDTIPEGSPGKSVTSNANDFVRIFLPKMAADAGDGRSKLQALHDMIADQSMTGPQIRRAFYGLAEDVGIKNKVLSFALLVSGRNDVMVLDRIQINRLFAGGEKIYDDVAHIFDGGPGLAIYEGLERSLGSRIQQLYDGVGRGDQASIGRYHWESWVLSSGQEVAHPTLETIVNAAKGADAPYANVPVMEGRTHKTSYGVTYERLPDGGNQFVYTTSNGDKFSMTKPQLDDMFTTVMKGKDKAVPKDFPGVNFFEKDTLPDGSPNPYFGKPWYTWPGVDRDRIDQLAATIGTKLDPASGAGSVEATVQGTVADGSKRTRSTRAGSTASVKRGRQAPQSGAN